MRAAIGVNFGTDERVGQLSVFYASTVRYRCSVVIIGAWESLTFKRKTTRQLLHHDYYYLNAIEFHDCFNSKHGGRISLTLLAGSNILVTDQSLHRPLL